MSDSNLSIATSPAADAIALAPMPVQQSSVWDDMLGIGVKGVAISRYLTRKTADGSSKLIAVPTDFTRVQQHVTDINSIEIGEGDMAQVKLNIMGHPVFCDQQDRPMANTAVVRLITCGLTTVAGRGLITVLSAADLSHPLNFDFEQVSSCSGFSYTKVRCTDLSTGERPFNLELHEQFKRITAEFAPKSAKTSRGERADLADAKNKAFRELIEATISNLTIPQVSAAAEAPAPEAELLDL